jgi:hypothetical protein
MAPQTRHQALLIVVYVFLGSAVLTLIPSDAKIVSDLGYHSLCPFAPWSTLLSLLGAGLVAAFRSYQIQRKD